MLLFCPSCSNVLTVATTHAKLDGSSEPEMVNCLECQTCPYQYVLNKRYFERKNFVRKEREDHYGGPGAWDNAPKSETQCTDAKCNGTEAAYYQVQIRSADEPMTSFYKCMTCGTRWRDD